MPRLVASMFLSLAAGNATPPSASQTPQPVAMSLDSGQGRTGDVKMYARQLAGR